ncbi:MAG: hypothetical protein ACRC31_06430 [Cetobacterium sp.]
MKGEKSGKHVANGSRQKTFDTATERKYSAGDQKEDGRKFE